MVCFCPLSRVTERRAGDLRRKSNGSRFQRHACRHVQVLQRSIQQRVSSSTNNSTLASSDTRIQRPTAPVGFGVLAYTFLAASTGLTLVSPTSEPGIPALDR